MKNFEKSSFLSFHSLCTFLFFFFLVFFLFRVKLWSFFEFSMVKISDHTYQVVVEKTQKDLFYHRQYFYILGEKVTYQVEQSLEEKGFIFITIKVKNWEGEEMISIQVPDKKQSIFKFILESWRIV